MLRPVLRPVRIATVLVPLIVSAACSKAEFSGDAGKRAIDPPQVIQKTITLSCDAVAPAQTIDIASRDTLKINVQGEFCPTSTNDLTVLFVVDASGSMGKHYEANSNRLNPGNDPRDGDACGRLAAMNAVVDQMKNDSATLNAQIGLVTFAGGVVERRDLQGASAFAASLSAELACNFVSQGDRAGYHPANPGGVRANVNASTNYAAALDAAEAMLGDVAGRKVVYFVSDGMPTSGGIDPAGAGIEAGERLRALSDVTLNGLLLGQSGAEAKTIMTNVVGNSDRVRVATSASELATEITKFPAAAIDAATLVATLIQPDGEKSLGVSATQSATPGAFGYATEVVELTGTPGEAGTTELKFAVSAKSADGQGLSATQAVTVRRL